MKKKDNCFKIKHVKLFLCLMLVCFSTSLFYESANASSFDTAQPQSANSKKVSLDITKRPLSYVLSEIKKQTGLGYGFRDVKSDDRTEQFSIRVRDASVGEALNTLLKGTNYTFEINNGIIVIGNKANRTPGDESNIITVGGRVTDEKGNPLQGANVVVYGTSTSVVSDAQGRFSIKVKSDGLLSFSFLGYSTEIVNVHGKTTINVSLQPSEEKIEEVTVVAFGEQKTESVVSSITTVRPMDLKSSNSDLTASFAGKIAGIVGWQVSGLPAALTEQEMNTKFYIRGVSSFQEKANTDPLILVDGVETSKLDLSRIPVEDIDSFSVMKDASATAMYGARGANGVILVSTKKGAEGNVYTSVRYEAIMSMPTSRIDVVDPVTYMKMYNQALLARSPSATPKYSVERISRTGSSKYPSWVYPANDWHEIMFKDFQVNHHMGFTVRGGSKIVQYYASLNHNRDKGMLNTDRLNQFKVNIQNNQTTFRANMNIDLKAGIKLIVNSTATLDKYHGPLEDVSQAYKMAFSVSPVDFAATYPADNYYNWPHMRFGTYMSAGTNGATHNPYAMLQRGYKDRKRLSITNRAEYIQNLHWLLKGLEFRASLSLNSTNYQQTAYNITPHLYSLLKYDFETGEHRLLAENEKAARRTLQVNTQGAASTADTQVTYEARLLHVAAWGGIDNNKHQTSLVAVLNAQERTATPVAAVLDGMPKRNLGLSMRGTYGLKERYFAEASFGYNGSERFAKDNKMGFFPAMGAAWIISKEQFMQSVTGAIQMLKLRLSYGKVGNDGIISTPRFVYLTTMRGEYVQSPAPNGGYMDRVLVYAYPNPTIQWEIAEQTNLGLDVKLFKGIFEFNVDIYNENRHNVISRRTTIPASIGIEIAPLDNVGTVRSRGLDFNGKIQYALTSDLWIILNGTFTYNKAIYKKIEEATDKPVWQRKVGKEISQSIGYIDEGLFRDWAEINNSPRQSNAMPGDIRYRDLNDDGVIDVNDATYIGFPTVPRITYGFHGYINYKNLEFSFAFQGSGKRGFFIDPQKISPFYNNNAMLTAIQKDHWSEENASPRPFWPRLSVNSITNNNPLENWGSSTDAETRKSTYFMRESRFLRCTSLELSYTMPERATRKMKLQNVKFYVRTNNPFIISDFKLWDIELGDGGFNYPIQKTFSLGFNMSF